MFGLMQFYIKKLQQGVFFQSFRFAAGNTGILLPSSKILYIKGLFSWKDSGTRNGSAGMTEGGIASRSLSRGASLRSQ